MERFFRPALDKYPAGVYTKNTPIGYFRAYGRRNGSGGCNPWPIFAGSMRVTDATAAIGHDHLKQAAQLFANRKSAFRARLTGRA